MHKGKKYVDSAKTIDRSKQYEPAEALSTVVSTAKAKFDETIELHVKLGVDSRHADQQVRGAIVLPHGTGKNVRVAVFACGTGRSYAHPRRADQIQQCGRIDVLYGSYFTEPRSRPDIETRKVSIVANMDFCIVWRYICTITHCIIQCFIIHLSCKHMESLF